MEINTRTESDLVILEPFGKILASDSFEFKREIERIIQGSLSKRLNKFIVDFGEVPLMDSIGLYAIITLFLMVSKKGGRMVFANLREGMRAVFTTTKLDTVFETEYTTGDAIDVLNQI